MNTRWRTALRQGWVETSPSLWKFYLVMWTAGACVIGCAVLLEPTGFWNERPFLTNLASSLVGALFGIPIALVALQRIQALESDRSAERRARRIADDLLREAESTLVGVLLISPPDLGLLSSVEDKCNALISQLDELASPDSSSTLATADVDLKSVELVLSTHDYLAMVDRVRNVESVFGLLFQPKPALKQILALATRRWNRAREASESIFLSSGLAPFDPIAVDAIGTWLNYAQGASGWIPTDLAAHPSLYIPLDEETLNSDSDFTVVTADKIELTKVSLQNGASFARSLVGGLRDLASLRAEVRTPGDGR